MTPGRLAGIERWFLRGGVFLLPLAYWWDTYDRWVLPKLLVARVLVIGLLILFVARAIVSGTLAIKRTALDLPLLAFVCSAVVSTLFAYNQNVAVFGIYSRYDGVLTILTYAALFWLSVQALKEPAEARTLLRVLLASGYLVAGIAILQSVTDSIAVGGLVPAFGTLGQKNVLGAFLAMLLPLAARELLEVDARSQMVLALNLLAVIGVALLLTLSRSAWSGAALSAVVLIAGGYRPAFRIGLAAACAALLGGLIVASLSLGGTRLVERNVDPRALAVSDLGAPGDRPAIWRDSLKLIASRPLVGYGPDNFGLVFPPFLDTDLGRQQWDKAHAESLQIAATQGLVGLAAYALMLAAFVRAFWRGRNREGAVAIFAAWLAYQVTLQPNFSAIAASLPFWVFAAAAMETWGAAWRRRPIPLAPARLAAVGAAPVMAALTGLAVMSTALPYLADARLLTAVKADLDGRRDEARAAAAQALELAPHESVYAVEMANIAFESEDWVSAADSYGVAARLGTYNPLVYRNLALADRNLGRFAEGRAAARKAVELDRFDPANRALLAQFEAPGP